MSPSANRPRTTRGTSISGMQSAWESPDARATPARWLTHGRRLGRRLPECSSTCSTCCLGRAPRRRCAHAGRTLVCSPIAGGRGGAGRLGQPALWSAAFHWCGVQAAIASDRPDALIPHADAISEAAQVSRHAQTLAAAGHTWVRVLGRDIDPSAINLAVEGLSGIGLRWDASRLAAQAALHCTDRRVSLDLLNLARAAHSGQGRHRRRRRRARAPPSSPTGSGRSLASWSRESGIARSANASTSPRGRWSTTWPASGAAWGRRIGPR